MGWSTAQVRAVAKALGVTAGFLFGETIDPSSIAPPLKGDGKEATSNVGKKPT